MKSINKNTIYFYKYLKDNGLTPDKYKNVLELGQSVINSVSQYFDNEYEQYLLSERVYYTELIEYKIKGARGWLNNNEIFVPKSIMADEYFNFDNLSREEDIFDDYDIPSINSFDVVVCMGISKDLLQTIKLSQDKYFGLCYDKNDVNQRIIHIYRVYEILRNKLNGYELITDTDSKNNKEFILLKRKN